LWRHTFKHSKFDFLLYGIVNGVVIIAMVVFIVVAAVSYQR
jgi:Co/Zn/Cd efflux system component